MKINQQAISIIMTAHDQADELKENLPTFLSQAYEPGYEVIVVDEASTDDTSEVLKLYKQESPLLYTTFLPKSNTRSMRRKMAFNIGLKASKNEWVILNNVKNNPKVDNELQTIADALDDEAEITLGYFSKKGIRLQSFLSYEDARHHLFKAERKLKHVYNRRLFNYSWGRYNFIVFRKDVGYNALKYFEHKISPFNLLAIRITILFKNMIGRSATTFIKYE